MSIQVTALEARILRILVDWYPITVEELRDELNLRKDVLERTLHSMAVKGFIELEPLSDKTYIRLRATGMDLSKLAPEGKKRRKPEKREPAPSEDDSIMYR
ncbi:MAG TPA: hypothetical protein VGB78_06780 [Thermoplasmata archaeon]|jgi:DNA-binding MarR family transcriptional regulator